MYPRLAMKFCQRSLYRGLTDIRLRCSTLSHVPKKDMEKQTMDLVSKKFPGYKVIYVFPYIAHASAFNAGKRRITYLTGAVVPLTIGLGLIDVISFNVAGSIIISGKILRSKLHLLTIHCSMDKCIFLLFYSTSTISMGTYDRNPVQQSSRTYIRESGRRKCDIILYRLLGKENKPDDQHRRCDPPVR